MRVSTSVFALFVGVLLLSGCLSGSAVEPKPLPDRPQTLDNASALEYAVQYESALLHNQVVRESDASSIAAIETCRYPAESPHDGALDYWVEKRQGDQFYITLRCPVEIGNKGAEQSGSGYIGEWVTYAVTPASTSRVELGNDVVAVRNRTVNFDEAAHTVTLRVSIRDDEGSTFVAEATADLDARSYSTLDVTAPRNATYEVRMRVDGANATSYTVAASKGTNVFARTGIYVSPTGVPVVDRPTETYRTLSA